MISVVIVVFVLVFIKLIGVFMCMVRLIEIPGQDVVRLADLLELFCGFLVIGVLIRMGRKCELRGFIKRQQVCSRQKLTRSHSLVCMRP